MTIDNFSFCWFFMLLSYSEACIHLYPHTHTHTATQKGTDQSMVMILINSENSLVRGLSYTSHLSSLFESRSDLVVWKWGCINDVNPWKISSGCGAPKREGVQDKMKTDWEGARWTEIQPRGSNVSLHEFPHVSISHLFFPAVCGFRLHTHTFTCQYDRQ